MLQQSRFSKTETVVISLAALAILLLSGLVAVPSARAFANGEAEAVVIGQTGFTSSTSGTTQNTLSDPQGTAFDSSGNLWVADSGNNRVLEFSAPLSTGESASIVLGEGSFNSSSITCSYSTNINASCLSTPEGIAFDSSGDLWVADSASNRIVEFTPPFTNDENASIAIGQPNLTTGAVSGASPSATDLNLPEGISFDGSGNLWVADSLDNRVLEFKAPLSTGEAASVVLGQDNFTTGIDANYASGCTSGQECPTASSLTDPDGVSVDSAGNVWTSERGTGRVLEFQAPFTNGESASLVLGQQLFTTFGDAGGFYCSAVTPAQFCVSPDSVTFDKSGSMWVADTDNSRVVRFDQPFSTYENESLVLGTSSYLAITPVLQIANSTNLSIPEAVAIDSSGNVWVTDSGQNRIVEFPASTTGTTQSSSSVSSASTTQRTQSTPTTSSQSASTGATSASTTTTSSTSGGGGVPVFPYQVAIASIFTVLLVGSYLLIRHRTVSRGPPGAVPPVA